MMDDSREALICRGFLAGPAEASLADHFTRFLEAAAGAMLLVRARPLSEAIPRRLSVDVPASPRRLSKPAVSASSQHRSGLFFGVAFRWCYCRKYDRGGPFENFMHGYTVKCNQEIRLKGNTAQMMREWNKRQTAQGNTINTHTRNLQASIYHEQLIQHALIMSTSKQQ